jgi:hypothetical protein
LDRIEPDLRPTEIDGDDRARLRAVGAKSFASPEKNSYILNTPRDTAEGVLRQRRPGTET